MLKYVCVSILNKEMFGNVCYVPLVLEREMVVFTLLFSLWLTQLHQRKEMRL